MISLETPNPSRVTTFVVVKLSDGHYLLENVIIPTPIEGCPYE